MPRIVVDESMAAEFAAACCPVAICDSSGVVLGSFRPVSLPMSREEALALVPFSDEEIEEFSKERTGRPLAEILAEAKKEHGE